MKERYFICHECGELSTWTEQMRDCEHGGTGLCDCRFMSFEWDAKYNGLEPWYPREYLEWIEISKKWYDWLKGVSNHVLRVRWFLFIPKKERM